MRRRTAKALLAALDALRQIATAAGPDLDDAPALEDWRIVMDDGGLSLVGRVTGHPHIADGRLVQTSVLLAVAADATWARTLNRFYHLRRPANSPPLQ